jgi:hypothetical protein
MKTPTSLFQRIGDDEAAGLAANPRLIFLKRFTVSSALGVNHSRREELVFRRNCGKISKPY